MGTSGMACPQVFLIKRSGFTRMGIHGIKRTPTLATPIVRLILLDLPTNQHGVTQVTEELQEATILETAAVVMIHHPTPCPMKGAD
jgi:hypothetical protein